MIRHLFPASCLAALLISGCAADLSGLYEVVEHLHTEATCEASTEAADPLGWFQTVHEKDGLAQELQFYPCEAADDCADEPDWDWTVNRGAVSAWDGYSIGAPGGNMNPDCEVNALFVVLEHGGGELRYTLEERHGYFDRPSDLDCIDAVKQDRELVDCVYGEVRVGQLLD